MAVVIAFPTIFRVNIQVRAYLIRILTAFIRLVRWTFALTKTTVLTWGTLMPAFPAIVNIVVYIHTFSITFLVGVSTFALSVITGFMRAAGLATFSAILVIRVQINAFPRVHTVCGTRDIANTALHVSVA